MASSTTCSAGGGVDAILQDAVSRRLGGVSGEGVVDDDEAPQSKFVSSNMAAANTKYTQKTRSSAAPETTTQPCLTSFSLPCM